MTDRPIIFSAPMVRALIEGRKTQTRRILKPQIVPCLSWSDPPPGTYPSNKGWSRFPYAKGDRLWVKETWRPDPNGRDHVGGIDLFYRADRLLHYATPPSDWKEPKQAQTGCVSPLFMPRWSSRLTLTVTEVRVQRLQQISAEDVAAEGACELAFVPPTDEDTREAREVFRALWNSLHGPDAWDANPWVVAVTFTVEQRNIDA